MYFVDFEKNKPEDDGGKSRRTQFVIKLLTERESRVDNLVNKTSIKAVIVQDDVNNVGIDGKTHKTWFEQLSTMFSTRIKKQDYPKILVSLS
jgi:hypothetical protein